jgi:16S rRNA (guanine966-N2)-methyltransferase
VTRVIAGVAGGRRLAVPGGSSTRPTSDRAREGLFATLLSELGTLGGKRVLDLYAGSGAVGLEALSRGAESVLLVESDARAAAVIKANVKAVSLPGARMVTSRVERLLARPPAGTPVTPGTLATPGTPTTPGTPATSAALAASATLATQDTKYDLVFADPPYAVTAIEITKVLTLLAAGWLADGALVVMERATRSGALDWPPGYTPGKSRRYGEATFWYGWYGSGTVTGDVGTGDIDTGEVGKGDATRRHAADGT